MKKESHISSTYFLLSLVKIEKNQFEVIIKHVNKRLFATTHKCVVKYNFPQCVIIHKVIYNLLVNNSDQNFIIYPCTVLLKKG